MNITDEALPDGVTKINLSGRMDIEGIAQIEAKFTEMAGPPTLRVIVDMAEVPYMSSVGIRALLMNAKSLGRRGGKFALLAPQPNVKNVLVTSGIDRIMSINDDLASALAVVSK